MHGEDEANKAQTAARALFSGAGDDANMPTFAVPETALADGTINIVDMLLLGGIEKSKGKIRTLIEQGSVQLDGERVDDTWLNITREQLETGVKIRKGKKVHIRFSL